MINIGVQIHPQHGSAREILFAWQRACESGFSSIWTWDHSAPLKPGLRVASLEAWTLLAAAAARTKRSRIGALVTCAGIRPPELLADMARTVDEISGGRLVLGLGAGWRSEDFTTYGVEFRRSADRLDELTSACHRIRARWNATGGQQLPILVGGRGAMLPLAAKCDIWNAIGSPSEFTLLNARLDRACQGIGRSPGAVRRSVLLRPIDEPSAAEYVVGGAQELILGWPAPYDVASLWARRSQILRLIDVAIEHQSVAGQA